MTSIFDTILEKAESYLDTRQNDIHIALSYDFARQLLSFYPEADAAIVLPAVILHDVGWKMVPEDEQLNAFGPNMNNKEMQRLHEVEGVRIAREILESLDYGAERIKEILSSIDGHDTRRKALSLNDAIIKDADKLWRYTPVGAEIDHSRFNSSWEDHLKMLERSIDRWLFTDEAKEMARAALSEAHAQCD
jgi:HD superfamily phosphohydrolase YqeK